VDLLGIGGNALDPAAIEHVTSAPSRRETLAASMARLLPPIAATRWPKPGSLSRVTSSSTHR
jgi:hypothetical protein